MCLPLALVPCNHFTGKEVHLVKSGEEACPSEVWEGTASLLGAKDKGMPSTAPCTTAGYVGQSTSRATARGKNCSAWFANDSGTVMDRDLLDRYAVNCATVHQVTYLEAYPISLNVSPA